MRIIIVRHGETLENIQDILMGHMPGTLSELGIEQARKVALRLKDERFDHIFSSDLKRSFDTANHIRVYHPQAVFSVTESLREVHMGAWQGKTKKELGFTETYRPQTPPDFETWDKVCERAQRFLGVIKKDYSNKRVLLVGHSGINRALIAVLNGITHERISEVPHQHNTGINIFEMINGNYQPLVLNCRKHLD